MSKQVKDMVIADLKQRLQGTRDLIVVDVSKLDGHTTTNLRVKLRAKNIHVLAVKNSLARQALGSLGVAGLDPYLEGPSALVYGGQDIVALAREIVKSVKDAQKLEIKGGTLDGGTSLNAKQVDELSKSAGREELLGRVLMLIRSPGGRIAGSLLGPGGKLAGQVKSIAEKEGEAPPAATS